MNIESTCIFKEGALCTDNGIVPYFESELTDTTYIVYPDRIEQIKGEGEEYLAASIPENGVIFESTAA